MTYRDLQTACTVCTQYPWCQTTWAYKQMNLFSASPYSLWQYEWFTNWQSSYQRAFAVERSLVRYQRHTGGDCSHQNQTRQQLCIFVFRLSSRRSQIKQRLRVGCWKTKQVSDFQTGHTLRRHSVPKHTQQWTLAHFEDNPKVLRVNNRQYFWGINAYINSTEERWVREREKICRKQAKVSPHRRTTGLDFKLQTVHSGGGLVDGAFRTAAAPSRGHSNQSHRDLFLAVHWILLCSPLKVHAKSS